MDLTEPEVVKYAMENGLCDSGGLMGGGATSIKQKLELLDHYGFEAHCEFANVATPERIADALESGHGVLLDLNSGILQDRDWKTHMSDYNGEIVATHTVCATGTARDLEGNLLGIFICDSSGQTPDSGRTFVSLDKLKECYSNVGCGCAMITNEAIR